MIAQQYESQKILSATPMELILMLYDHGIRAMAKALEADRLTDDIERMNRFNENLLRAQDYVAELACSLDVERGGEMAQELNRLYDFMMNHLITANTEGRPEPVEAVKAMLEELRDGWAQAMQSVPQDKRPEPVPVERTSSFRFSG